MEKEKSKKKREKRKEEREKRKPTKKKEEALVAGYVMFWTIPSIGVQMMG
jgi:hypothetical protein